MVIMIRRVIVRNRSPRRRKNRMNISAASKDFFDAARRKVGWLCLISECLATRHINNQPVAYLYSMNITLRYRAGFRLYQPVLLRQTSLQFRQHERRLTVSG